jgi:choline dehydrogenase-like flavoprotein
LETLRVPLAIKLARLYGGGRYTGRHARALKRMSNLIAVTWADESIGRISHLPFVGTVVRYTMSPDDMRKLLSGLKLIVKRLLADGAEEVYPGIIGMPEVLTPKDYGAVRELFDRIPADEPWRVTGVVTHLFGGAVWGTNRYTSVARWRDGRVYTTDNLHIVDASGFPKNIGVNPQLTIMAMSIHLARAISGTL